MAGYLYFIKAKGTDFYKIGISDNPESRLKQLQTGNPVQLELVSSIYCLYPKDRESELHSALSELNENGEWFSIKDDDVKELIEQEYCLARDEFLCEIQSMITIHGSDYLLSYLQSAIDSLDKGEPDQAKTAILDLSLLVDGVEI